MSSPTVACPTCGKKVRWSEENEFRPFCSERCKLIDLGEWAAERHRVSGDADYQNSGIEEDDDSD